MNEVNVRVYVYDRTMKKIFCEHRIRSDFIHRHLSCAFCHPASPFLHPFHHVLV
jgi:hypothetical protein